MNPSLPIYDAHNHLQDPRLASHLPNIIEALTALPVRKAVVNGTRPEDWPAVAELARRHGWIIPSYGLHPWHVNQVCENWRDQLTEHLRDPKAAIGEIGLDRWIPDHDTARQEDAFLYQLHLASSLNRPVTIHCLKAWGCLLEILQQQKLPSGFLLHSYGGPAEMIPAFTSLGAYFSLSGHFAHPRKTRQREAFQKIPTNRLLIETDAPDMIPPPEFTPQNLPSNLNHPANIQAIYTFASELYNLPLEQLTSQIETNFNNFFRPIPN